MLSRLYTGAWNQELFNQDFQLEYDNGSIMDRYREENDELDVELTVFNSTSLASDSVVRWLSQHQKKLRRNVKRKGKAYRNGRR